MFNSTKFNDSSKFLKTTLLNPYDETIHEPNRSFLSPKITSTPLHSVFGTPPKNQIMTPRRYSLSDVATPPRSSRREHIRIKSQYPPGPLLASTKFNLNVSTFADAKSPGLVNRIVQYNDEVERRKDQRRPATHQAKYGTVGLFPIVHLFKDKLPVLEQKPRRVTVRVASPDYVKHTPEYNRKLLEGLVKPSGSGHSISHLNHSENSTSTRSVLDALKEISRKRIHASEEVELHEDTGKRLRTESEDCTDSNKRGRDESPLLETSTSPVKPASKKICMYDEYSASRSSMDFDFNRSESKRKYISISTLTENPKESKQVKLINVETQTIEEEQKKIEETSSLNESVEEVETDKSKKVKSVLKVFDDAPLERIRKNRLAALMGTLVGKDPVLEPKPDYPTLLRDEKDKADDKEIVQTIDKPLVSILSQKSPKKLAKHVTFNIPETVVENNATTVTSSASLAPSTTQISVDIDKENTPENMILIKPISTQAQAVMINVPTFTFGSTFDKPDSPSSASSATPSFVNTSTVSPSPFTPKSLTAEAPKTIPSFVFGGNKTLSNSSAGEAVTSSPPKIGGFKFDLEKPVQISDTTKSSFSLNSQATVASSSPFAVTTSVSVLTSPITSTLVTPNKADTSSTGLAFGGVAQSVATSFTTPTSLNISVSSSENVKPSFTFGPPAANIPGTPFNFGKTLSNSATTTPSGFSSLFGTTSSTGNGFNAVITSVKTCSSTVISVANKDLITSPSATSTFGTASTIPAFSSFQPKSDPSVGFGIPPTTNSGVGASTTTIGFVIPVTSNTTGFGASTTNTNFNSNPNFVATTTPSFGNTPTPSFGTTTSGFGSTVTSGFGTTTNPTFGTTNTSTPSFGTTNTSTPSFGTTITSTPSFATTNTATPSFGTTTPNFGNTATPGFGSTTPGFGNNATQGFGTSTTPAFGTPVTSANNIFGPSTNSTNFGSCNFVAPVTLGSSFGTATTVSSGFGTATGAGVFGNAANNAPGFHTPTTSAFNFGGNTTASNTGFGVATTVVTTGFGTTTASGFGPNTGSIFAKSNVPSFGGTTASSFGSNNTGSSFTEAPFGAPVTSTPAFGTATTTSSFNFGGTNASFTSPSTTISIFGTTQSPFGSGAATTSSSSGHFTFTGKNTTSGTFPSTNTTTPSFGNTFGQSNTGFGNQTTGFGTPNKNSTFGNVPGNVAAGFGNAIATQAFGTTQPAQPFGTAASSFNKVQSPSQGNFGSPQFSFNQQQNSTPSRGPVFTFGSGAGEKSGVFNFGTPSGETTKKFDFNAGNTAPPAFGASFGGNTASAPAFGAAAPMTAGGFSIGAGPPASNRPRTQIKAKRRT